MVRETALSYGGLRDYGMADAHLLEGMSMKYIGAARGYP
jgi:hypothetical protein